MYCDVQVCFGVPNKIIEIEIEICQCIQLMFPNMLVYRMDTTINSRVNISDKVTY